MDLLQSSSPIWVSEHGAVGDRQEVAVPKVLVVSKQKAGRLAMAQAVGQTLLASPLLSTLAKFAP
jgi:hypothetical protein